MALAPRHSFRKLGDLSKAIEAHTSDGSNCMATCTPLTLPIDCNLPHAHHKAHQSADLPRSLKPYPYVILAITLSGQSADPVVLWYWVRRTWSPSRSTCAGVTLSRKE